MQSFKLNLAVLVISGFLCYASAFYNNLPDFKTFIEPRCYNGTNVRDKVLVNGQEYPLSQTFENFLSLVEKFDDANPNLSLEDTLFIFLRNFTHEHLFRREGSGFLLNTPVSASLDKIIDLWEEEKVIPEHVNPYDDDEICSLFFMLSHTVNDTAVGDEKEPKLFSTPSTPLSSPPNEESRSYVKDKLSRAVIKTKYPREQGIVIIRSSGETVALGQVILGLYLGLREGGEPLSKLLPKKSNYDGDQNQQVYPLYILTLSDTLLMSKWEQFIEGGGKQIGGNVIAVGVNNRDVGINTNYICPTVFKLAEDATSFLTYSLIRGSTDGLLLGSIVKDISSSPTGGIKLTQVLRSYYSPLGIHVTQKDANPAQNFFSFCHRSDLFKSVEAEVKHQMELLLAIMSPSYESDKKKLSNAWDDFEGMKENIFKQQTGIEFCEKYKVKDTMENLNCETPVDVIVVLDTTNKDEEIRLQQEIVGYMATYLQMSSQGSTVTIYLDHLNESSTTDLEELVPQTYSSACVACHVVQKEIPSGGADRKLVLQALDKQLEERKSMDKDLTGTNGKVVVYFNFKDKEETDNRLNQIIYRFFKEHSDVPFIVVGRNEDVLKKYAGQNQFSIIRLVSNEETQKIGENLAQKICLGPAAFQYEDCKVARDEKNAMYEGFVTKHSVQHWGMDTKYFEKSYTAKLFFEAIDGHIKVCHNRATTKPELVEQNCHKTNSSVRRVEIVESNPCKGLSGSSCPPIYFSVIGIEPNQNGQINDNHICSDPKCESFNQVKFKFTHEGVRCSGCVGLLSNSVVLFVSAILAYFMCAK